MQREGLRSAQHGAILLLVLSGKRWSFEHRTGYWKNNAEYATELALILNWKIWYWQDKNEALARLYDELWRETDQWCMENLKDEDLQYYLQTTD